MERDSVYPILVNSSQHASDSAEFGPFGQVDGALGDLREHLPGYVTMPTRDGIGRSASDANVRVVVGRLGAGKSLFLRRMQDHQAGDAENAFAIEVTRNSSDIQVEDLSSFAKMMGLNDSNVEVWSLLWRRALVRSAASLIFARWGNLSISVEAHHLEEFEEDYKELLRLGRRPERATASFAWLLRHFSTKRDALSYLQNESWNALEQMLGEILATNAPIHIYIDALDDNFKYGPSLWMQCQRGLYYTTVSLRDMNPLGGRLVVVVALRDVVFTSAGFFESAPRLQDALHTNVLHWGRRNILHFLNEKLAFVPDAYFKYPDDKSLASLLGHSEIENLRPTGRPESVEQYLIRHTRLIPRDVVSMGNALCSLIDGHDSTPSQDEIRDVIRAVARKCYHSQIAQTANQLWAEVVPAARDRLLNKSAKFSPNDSQVTANRDALIAAIREIGTELFADGAIAAFDATCAKQFPGPVPASDVLWTNQLLGIRDPKNGCRFYSLADMAENKLPRSPVQEYVWNPLVFDGIPEMQATLEHPCWPER